MINRLAKYRKLVTAIFILAPFIFCFYYCEVGDFANSKVKSTTPDFCTIVKAVKLETSRSSANELLKLKAEKYFTPPILNEINLQSTSINILDTEFFYPPPKTNNIFLYNCTFLI